MCKRQKAKRSENETEIDLNSVEKLMDSPSRYPPFLVHPMKSFRHSHHRHCLANVAPNKCSDQTSMVKRCLHRKSNICFDNFIICVCELFDGVFATKLLANLRLWQSMRVNKHKKNQKKEEKRNERKLPKNQNGAKKTNKQRKKTSRR